MNLSAKTEVVGWWLLGTSPIGFLVFVLTFTGTGFPAWLVTLTTLIIYYGIVAFPLGVFLVVGSQVMKLFKL